MTDMPEMLSIDDAVARLGASIRTIGETETVPISSATQRVLAKSVFAPVSLPPFNSSAMDGYAIKTSAGRSVGSQFRIVGTSFAGKPYEGTGSPPQGAVRIFTGAAVPAWADAVVLQEDVDRQDETIRLRERSAPGDNIRFIGHDVKKDELLLERGIKLGAFETSRRKQFRPQGCSSTVLENTLTKLKNDIRRGLQKRNGSRFYSR